MPVVGFATYREASAARQEGQRVQSCGGQGTGAPTRFVLVGGCVVNASDQHQTTETVDPRGAICERSWKRMNTRVMSAQERQREALRAPFERFGAALKNGAR